jgi:hypothetical protein
VSAEKHDEFGLVLSMDQLRLLEGIRDQLRKGVPMPPDLMTDLADQIDQALKAGVSTKLTGPATSLKDLPP